MLNNHALVFMFAAILFIMPTQDAFAMERDKKLHFSAGTGIGFISEAFTDDPLKSFLLCSSVGALKEIYDEIDYGGADEKDLLYTIAGCGIGILSSSALGIQIVPFSDGGMIKFEFEF